MTRLTSKMEYAGRKFNVVMGDTKPDWTNHRRPYALNHVSVASDFIERPSFGAEETEWKAWRRAENTLARPLVEAAMALMGVSSEVKWSARRYCSCGCSPVWVMERQYVPVAGFHGKGIYINIEEAK